MLSAEAKSKETWNWKIKRLHSHIPFLWNQRYERIPRIEKILTTNIFLRILLTEEQHVLCHKWQIAQDLI